MQPLVRARAIFLVLRANFKTFAGNIGFSLLIFPISLPSGAPFSGRTAQPSLCIKSARGANADMGDRLLSRFVRGRDYGGTDRGLETAPPEFWCESRPGDRSYEILANRALTVRSTHPTKSDKSFTRLRPTPPPTRNPPAIARPAKPARRRQRRSGPFRPGRSCPACRFRCGGSRSSGCRPV